MKFKVIYLEFSYFLNRFRCVIHGNDIIAIDDNKIPIVRKCLCFAKRGFYVELWYTHANGVSNLIQFLN